jgi:hypothetical protein
VAAALKYIRSHETTPMTIFLKYICIYIIVYVTFKLLPLLLFYIRARFDFGYINNYLHDIYVIAWTLSGIVFFVVRLSEPMTRDFIKDEVRYLYNRVKRCLFKCTCVGPGHSINLVPRNSLLATRVFEELNLEVIFMQKCERILITILVALFENVDNLSTPDIRR